MLAALHLPLLALDDVLPRQSLASSHLAIDQAFHPIGEETALGPDRAEGTSALFGKLFRQCHRQRRRADGVDGGQLGHHALAQGLDLPLGLEPAQLLPSLGLLDLLPGNLLGRLFVLRQRRPHPLFGTTLLEGILLRPDASLLVALGAGQLVLLLVKADLALIARAIVVVIATALLIATNQQRPRLLAKALADGRFLVLDGIVAANFDGQSLADDVLMRLGIGPVRLAGVRHLDGDGGA
mmetsp:Transcript_18766/g.53993  ORF Transcript_18766/g.53993 Transcript_18766/m.53993 type:complete len:239 (+) Transcript_18766:100-816(+)